MKTEHIEKLKQLEVETLEMYNRLDAFSLEDFYSVSGLETQVTGMDLLVLQDQVVKKFKSRQNNGIMMAWTGNKPPIVIHIQPTAHEKIST